MSRFLGRVCLMISVLHDWLLLMLVWPRQICQLVLIIVIVNQPVIIQLLHHTCHVNFNPLVEACLSFATCLFRILLKLSVTGVLEYSS